MLRKSINLLIYFPKACFIPKLWNPEILQNKWARMCCRRKSAWMIIVLILILVASLACLTLDQLLIWKMNKTFKCSCGNCYVSTLAINVELISIHKGTLELDLAASKILQWLCVHLHLFIALEGWFHQLNYHGHINILRSEHSLTVYFPIV